ncbi:LysR family transcriptional regulator [Bradyrhizobium sp. CB82]|uniref:LysR family transcriptional regulator n=1 Tax=Bradyrhizobium sp. CB82 TaxID=3039159 RepID=UPI0024B150FD|nr:LysR family transcriptional regulator [Bradyrhizobium sp. CB82]WFU39086.1 LysR family transcriptional regulator [Bradyrhizobium sp. CB82]
MDLLSPMKTFVRVVEASSFTAIASEQNTTQPTISRQIAALEDHLGARLLTRTTRAVTLTDDGRAFYEHALRALEAVSEAEGAVGRRRAKPSGTLRLTTPVVFGRLHIVPRLATFLARNRELSIDLVMSDTFIDLVEQGLDVAIRVGEITDPGLVTKRIGMVRRITVAAPAYLKRRRTPKTPDDLADHDCIVYSRLATGNRWFFERPQGPLTVDVKGRFRADNSEGVREAVVSGLGIAVIPAFAFVDEIKSGAVTVLLKDYEPKRLPLSAVYASRRFVPLKVRAIIDHLAHEFALDPSLSMHIV